MRADVRVDTRRCLGTGLCCAMRPDLFDLPGRHAVALRAVLDDDRDVEDAETIADCCPTEAVIVSRTED